MPCEQSCHVLPWKIQRLKPLSRTSNRHNLDLRKEDIEFGGDGGNLCDNVYIGDNISFLYNNGGDEEFWLLPIDQVVHTLHATIVDGWGQEFLEGEYVV